MDYFADCANLEEAKKKHRKLSLLLHPDRGGNEEQFKSMQNDYDNFVERHTYGGSTSTESTSDYWRRRHQQGEYQRWEQDRQRRDDEERRRRERNYGASGSGYASRRRRRSGSRRQTDFARAAEGMDMNDPTNWWIMVITIHMNTWKKSKASLSSAMSLKSPKNALKHLGILKTTIEEITKTQSIIDYETLTTFRQRQLYAAIKHLINRYARSLDIAENKLKDLGYIL